jgi:hypothetical protein
MVFLWNHLHVLDNLLYTILKRFFLVLFPQL